MRTSPQVTASKARRCVVYTRISKDIAGLGLGVERQRSECRELAAERGWDVIEVLDENDESATRGRGDRKQYRSLLGMLRAGEVDIVLVWAQDRLLREPLEMETLIELAESHPFVIEGVVDRGTDLATASGRREARRNVVDAKGEIERKSERQRSASMQRAKAGKPPTRRAFGYHQDGSVNEIEAVEVREAFSRYVAGGGLMSILRDWTARGVVNTAGKPFTHAGFRSSILRNPRYIAERWMDRRAGGKITSTFIGAGDWQPLVTEDVFRAAQARMDALSDKTTHGGAKKHLGSGLYFCGICADGASVMANYQQSHPGAEATRTLVYLCAKNRRTLGVAEWIDHYVETEIVAYLRDPRNRISVLMADDRNIAAVKAARDTENALVLRLKGLEDSLAEGMDPGVFMRVSATVNEKLTAARAEVARLGERSALALLEGSNDPGAAWLDLPIIEKSKVAAALAKITVHRGPGRRPGFDPASVDIEFLKKGV